MSTLQIYHDGDMICGLGSVPSADAPSASKETRRGLRLKTAHKTRRPRRIMRVRPTFVRRPAEEKELVGV